MAKNPFISVIIPCFNEADYIGFLLFSLVRQTFKNFEVIVSDGNSQDQTKEVVLDFARQFPNLIFVTSQKRSPAAQRNRGAKEAKSERLLFLDADVILPSDFLEKALREIEERELDLASPTIFPLTKRVMDQYFYLIINWGLELLENTFPIAGSSTIFSKASLHKKINGFDERLKVIAEDTDYVYRAVKNGARFGIIKSSSPYISMRRLDLEGRGSVLPNVILQGLYFGIFGKYKAQKFIERSYGDFGTFKKFLNKERKTNKFLSKLTRQQFEKLTKNLREFLGSF